MRKENQAQFQMVLTHLEKACENLKKSHQAFQEIEKINFLKEIVKEQIQQQSAGPNENTDSSIR